MMEQLIKVSSVPFQAIRFTQNARLVPARPLPPLLLLIHPYPAIRTRRSMHLLSRFRQKPLPLT